MVYCLAAPSVMVIKVYLCVALLGLRHYAGEVFPLAAQRAAAHNTGIGTGDGGQCSGTISSTLHPISPTPHIHHTPSHLTFKSQGIRPI